jgi:t-SNARE complex subunit (syntaxin)
MPKKNLLKKLQKGISNVGTNIQKAQAGLKRYQEQKYQAQASSLQRNIIREKKLLELERLKARRARAEAVRQRLTRRRKPKGDLFSAGFDFM